MTARPIVFDGGVLREPSMTGTGHSFLNTLVAYADVADRPLVLLVPPGVEAPEIPGVLIEAGHAGSLRRATRLPSLLRSLDAAVLHSPVAAIPLRAPCPIVATVHDLPWMAEPRIEGDDGDRFRQRVAVRIAARRAATVICVSRTTRRDLVRFLGRRPHARVRVVHPGMTTPDGSNGRRASHVLVLSADRPRKNLERVRRAHRLATERDPRVPPILLLGPPHRYVSETDKHRALDDAAALVHMSLFEGFGMPIVEAFGRGVPVACSERGSLREVAADAACFADPESVESIAAAIVSVTTDAALRERLRTRGLERARDFDVARAAAAWSRIHRELIP